MPLHRSSLAVLAAAAFFFCGTSAPRSPDRPNVSTIAGSGAVGLAAGNATVSAFIAPMGVAYDARGNLYVTDAGAQRIYEIDARGAVRSIAGSGAPIDDGFWVPGGYRDGAAATAQFDRPAGIAVGRDGAIYVADTYNHCIRKIAGGVVSTLTGDPQNGGLRDGPAGQALLDRPTGLALDNDGNLYTADYAALRKITPQGYVSTLSLGSRPYGVAVNQTAQTTTIFVADAYGIVAQGPDGHVRRYRSHDSMSAGVLDDVAVVGGDRELGSPFGLAAIDDETVAFTDPRTNSIRTLQILSHRLGVLAGSALDDGSGDSGAFADGNGEGARFDAPLGIALAPNGTLTVADSGNRRIRSLGAYNRPPDPWRSTLGTLYGEVSARNDAYTIALIGNSVIDYDTYPSQSIAAQLEAKLNAQSSAAGSPKRFRVVPVIAPNVDVNAMEQIAGLFDEHLFDAALMNVNLFNLQATYGIKAFQGPTDAQWTEFTSRLKGLHERMRASGVPLVVVTHPFAHEMSSTELVWLRLMLGDWVDHFAPDPATNRALNDAVAKAGVPVIDLTPPFVRYESLPNHRAIFGASDAHLSAAGRALYADAVARALESMKPWTKREH